MTDFANGGRIESRDKRDDGRPAFFIDADGYGLIPSPSPADRARMLAQINTPLATDADAEHDEYAAAHDGRRFQLRRPTDVQILYGVLVLFVIGTTTRTVIVDGFAEAAKDLGRGLLLGLAMVLLFEFAARFGRKA